MQLRKTVPHTIKEDPGNEYDRLIKFIKMYNITVLEKSLYKNKYFYN